MGQGNSSAKLERGPTAWEWGLQMLHSDVLPVRAGNVEKNDMLNREHLINNDFI